MWWKSVVRWVRERVDLDVDVDLDGKQVGLTVTVTVRFGDAVLLHERFDWPLPEVGKAAKLAGKAARRRSLLTEGV